MKLLSVTLSGIFAYEDEVLFNLSRTSRAQNLILLWGRNGQGKTSFTSSLKLLFAGVEAEASRRVGFPPQTLPPGQYVLGDGDHWEGVINRRVRRRAASRNEPAVASVEAVWESEGETVSARREFQTTATGSYVEYLSVSEGGVRITGTAAKERLAEVLPPDYVGFFFFDGEDIKALAETAERKSIDFDQLLRLSFASDLERELKEAAVERRRRTLKGQDRTALLEVKRLLQEARDIETAAIERISDLDEDILNRRSQLARLEKVRDNLSTGATQAQREALEASKTRLEDEVREVLSRLGKGRLPVIVPVLANLALVASAIAALDQRLEGDSEADLRVTRRIVRALPAWVDRLEVTLDASVKAEVVKGLTTQLHNSVPKPENSGLFASLDLERAARLKEALLKFAAGGADISQAHVAQLLALHRSKVALDEVTEQLIRLRVGSEANLERFRDVEREIKVLVEAVDELQLEKGGEIKRRDKAETDIVTLTAKQTELDALTKRARKDEDEARFIEKVAGALSEVRERSRIQARDEVEKLLNVRFKSLIFGHDLISRIRIDDSYTLNFFDSQDRPIGRASLSSGMKQLAATALQWAMMEASGHRMPVIIDTPLGRIDRENQDRMLKSYYPYLSDQVVLLPTNAELDARKLGLIADRVADEYTITNDTGDSAHVVRERLGGVTDGR